MAMNSEELAMLRESLRALLDEIAPPEVVRGWDRADYLPPELLANVRFLPVGRRRGRQEEQDEEEGSGEEGSDDEESGSSDEGADDEEEEEVAHEDIPAEQ